MASMREPEQGGALEPVGRDDALRLTEQLRAAIDDARRAAMVLAQRVREAHRARVWGALGHSGWGAYAQDELGISRAQAYRLIDIAESAGALNRAIGAAGVLADVSPAGDTDAAGLVDMGLSQRALREVHGQLDELTTVVTERLTAAAQAGQLEWSAVRAIVGQAVDELRRDPLPAAGDTAADDDALERALADAERHPDDTTVVRRLVDEMAVVGGRLGQSALELAPAFWSEQEAVDKILARYANDIGCDVETVLAARRYALTGDRRALEGTWL
ncbi:hypothetical protein [Streptomyces sp. ISL-100]|uniref:hypothetical protein n=1 Tax=Streptomyces sp. ISL-100 TaxID=2819173 RepID=UPI001BE8BF2E|nr:hypothetical protein [Streptomyces sp. ISL-100]MBT2401782.1 hypothetical protein [Streptomyces sp. ISL-100]